MPNPAMAASQRFLRTMAYPRAHSASLPAKALRIRVKIRKDASFEMLPVNEAKWEIPAYTKGNHLLTTPRTTTEWVSMKHPEVPEKLVAALDRLLATPLSDLTGELQEPQALIEHDTPLEKVFSFLLEFDHLWVKKSGGSGLPAGIITRRDILSSLMPPRSGYAGLRSSRQASVSRGTADCAFCYIFHKHPPVCRKDDTVADMVRIAVRSGETMVAVADGDRFVGELGVEGLLKKLFVLAGGE
jgi:CBS domain-containing protein